MSHSSALSFSTWQHGVLLLLRDVGREHLGELLVLEAAREELVFGEVPVAVLVHPARRPFVYFCRLICLFLLTVRRCSWPSPLPSRWGGWRRRPACRRWPARSWSSPPGRSRRSRPRRTSCKANREERISLGHEFRTVVRSYHKTQQIDKVDTVSYCHSISLKTIWANARPNGHPSQLLYLHGVISRRKGEHVGEWDGGSGGSDQ